MKVRSWCEDSIAHIQKETVNSDYGTDSYYEVLQQADSLRVATGRTLMSFNRP